MWARLSWHRRQRERREAQESERRETEALKQRQHQELERARQVAVRQYQEQIAAAGQQARFVRQQAGWYPIPSQVVQQGLGEVCPYCQGRGRR